jgi:hypothetical protein
VRARIKPSLLRLLAPYLVWILLHWGALVGAEHTFPRTWFHASGTAAHPPWYYIGQDFVAAVWFTAAAVLMLAFAVASSVRLGPNAWTALAVALTDFASKIGLGVNVLLHTSRLWEASNAVSRWPTLQAYQESRQLALTFSLSAGVLAFGACLLQYYRATRPSTEGVENGGSSPPPAE